MVEPREDLLSLRLHDRYQFVDDVYLALETEVERRPAGPSRADDVLDPRRVVPKLVELLKRRLDERSARRAPTLAMNGSATTTRPPTTLLMDLCAAPRPYYSRPSVAVTRGSRRASPRHSAYRRT